MRTVRQCPKCALRFTTTDELDDHLSGDHHLDPEDLPDRRSGHRLERAGDTGAAADEQVRRPR